MQYVCFYLESSKSKASRISIKTTNQHNTASGREKFCLQHAGRESYKLTCEAFFLSTDVE